jgi:hypothetical protein
MSGERQDRRRHPRERLELPCKLFHAATNRYLAGRTRDVSRSGVLIELSPGPAFVPGEPVAIGVSGAALLAEGDLIAARVVWSEGSREGPRRAALEFDEAWAGARDEVACF